MRAAVRGTLGNMKPFALMVLLLGLFVTGGPAVRAQAADPLAGAALLDALRGGGYVLLFRHAATDQSQRDADRKNLENCATQRNLSDQGREQAVAIGDGMRTVGVPVGVVLASPYCRTLATARLAFGRAEATNDLISESPDDSPGDRERLRAALRALLAQRSEPGTNTALVTHVLNIETALGFQIEEGEAIVVQPDESGGFTIVGRVLADGWAGLGAAADVAPAPPVPVTGGPPASL